MAAPAPETPVASFLDRNATPEWRQAHKLWSVQLSVFWAVVGGLWVAVPVFQGMVTPFVFVCLCVGMSLLILFARLTNQPGLP
jgi:hypothetical protein